jgi:DNA-binding LacI/PurR family transcriptional regulator
MLTKHDFGLPETAEPIIADERFGTIVVNPFYSHIQAGIENECRKRNISLMFSNIEVDEGNRPVMWPAMVREQRVDGLLLMGTFLDGTADQLKRVADVPVILVDSYGTVPDFDSIVIDNAGGVRQGIDHLVDLGHTRIGLVGWMPATSPGIQDRHRSYVKTLQDHGLDASTFIEPSKLSRPDAYDATTRLLQRCPQVTAILAANDDTAMGALFAARHLGRAVPRDLSILGFDNIDLAKEAVPPMTTIHVPKSWMGILGVRFLIERVNNPDQPKITVTVSTQLVIRGSTCPPNP